MISSNPLLSRYFIIIVLQLTLLIGLLPNSIYGQSRFSVDSLFGGTAPDTLNVQQFDFSSWVYDDKGVFQSNAADGPHNYHPLYNASLLRNDLGNIASAEHVILFDHSPSFGFNFRTGRSAYWRKVKNRAFLLSEKMFSNVHYANGAKRENYLMANLTRGFGQLLNMGFSFNRISSEGFYDRQRNVLTDIIFYTTFHTKDDRYKAVMMFDYTDLEVEENGGLLIDSVFEENLTSGRNFVPVNLSLSSNRWKGIEVGLEQRFFLMKEDSTKKARNYRPAISHSFAVNKHAMIYKGAPDTSILFYENIFFDSVATYDSTSLLGVTNALRFELVKSDSVGQKLLNRLAVGAMHEYHRVAYDSIISKINNVGIVAAAEGMFLGKLNWNASGNFMLLGYNILDTKLDFGLDYEVGRSLFSGTVTYSRYRPDLITDNYTSNHFVWDNTRSQTQHLRAQISYRQNRLRFNGSLTYHLLDDVVVFGTDRLPFQSNTANQILVFQLREHFKMRWFHLILNGALQTSLSGADFRIPLALGRGMFYYQNDLFKKKLRLQIGVEVSYSTSYFANAYNPALSAFHLQNDKQVGNYPFIDVFLNLRIKKFRAFFKVEHINAGWLGYTYYRVPHYPANDLAWKFGVNWAFLD